jgi:hypothetical protein
MTCKATLNLFLGTLTCLYTLSRNYPIVYHKIFKMAKKFVNTIYRTCHIFRFCKIYGMLYQMHGINHGFWNDFSNFFIKILTSRGGIHNKFIIIIKTRVPYLYKTNLKILDYSHGKAPTQIIIVRCIWVGRHDTQYNDTQHTDAQHYDTQQGILKGEISLYCWPPVWLVWISLFCK